MNELDEITLRRVDRLFAMLRALPADEGRIRWEYWDELMEYSAELIALVMKRLQEPSNN
jgi:hypothetical protein